MANFTLVDIAQSTVATFAFALFLLPPGFLLGEASNVFGMRDRSSAEKIVLSVALSFAAAPILAVLLTRLFSYAVTIPFFLLLAAIAITLLACRLRPRADFFSHILRGTWLLVGMLLAWFLIVQFSLADLQIGHRLYVSFVAYDQSVRVPLVEAAARTGVPPVNPFYGVGKIPSLRYFYYWYVVCALPMRLLGVSAKACLNASVFWSGTGLASMVPLFLKYVLEEKANLRTKSLIGIALLGVTGLDLIPYIALRLGSSGTTKADLEWWDPNQVTSWLGSLLWVPHHIASLVACMTGLLVFSRIDEDNSLRQRLWLAGLSAMAFASAGGLSLYVTFTFALFVGYWALVTLAEKQFKTFLTYLAAGVFTFLLSFPYLLDLLPKPVSAGSQLENSQTFAYFALRTPPPIVDPFSRFAIHSPILLELSKLPGLLITYFLEFGFFAVVVILALRRDLTAPGPLSRPRRMFWTMFAICLLAMTVLRSDTTGVNDLGFRGMLVVQFVLLILAAPLLYNLSRQDAAEAPHRVSLARLSLLFTLLLGVAGTAYQLIALRAYAPLADAGRVERDEVFLGTKGFAERTYWLRVGFTQLDKLTPSTALVQYDPVREEVTMAHLYSTRQTVMGDRECASAFGGDLENCTKALPSVFMVFNGAEAMKTRNLDAFCDEFHVNVLVVDDVDPVWKYPGSWVWDRPTLIANPSFRAIPCGTQPLPPLAH
jgi:hypothetical protein